MISLRKMTQNDLVLFKKWLSAPHIARWYEHPRDWVEEVEQQDGVFRWLHHFMVEYEGESVGFCQYYACLDSDEPWEGYTALGGSYSIDYLIGEPNCLRRGLGKQVVAALLEQIKAHPDAERVVVKPDEENQASCALLLSCGFLLDEERRVYVKTL